MEAYRQWLTMREPQWARVSYNEIDFQDLYYHSAPKQKRTIASLDEIDPEILKTYEKLAIPLREVEVLEDLARPEGERRVAVGARWRRDRRSPGNIRVASCAATIRVASSTRSRSPTAASRSTAARR